MPFRPDIEGIRAIAVLLVVLAHAGVPFLQGGYVGVDVFFVISGFLITSLLFSELERTGTISIRRFYARRAVRLLPAATLVILATLFAAWLWLPVTRFKSIVFDAVSSAFYVINYRLAVNGTDYLASEEAPSPFQHFWSLAVEEQFYLVWPILLILTAVIWRKRPATVRRPIFLVLLLLAVVSFSLSVTQTASAAPWAYFGIHTRAWELALGAFVALSATQAAKLPKALASAISWLGLAAVVTAAVRFDAATEFPGYLALLPTAGAALLIFGGCAKQGDVQGLLSTQPMQLIGKLSYGWYLWHWPLLIIGPAAFGIEPSITAGLGLAGAGLLLAAISYELVENPLRGAPSLRRRPFRGIGLGVAMSGMVALASVLAVTVLPQATGTGNAADPGLELTEGGFTQEQLTELLIEAAETTTVPANLKPSLEDAKDDQPVTYPDGCHLGFDETTAESDCLYGDPNGENTMVLMGDSHAAQWFPALEAIAREAGWRLFNATKSACPVADVATYNSTFDRPYTECIDWRNATFEWITQTRPQLAVISTSDGNSADGQGNLDQLWLDGISSTVDRLQEGDTRVAYLADTPSFAHDVPECIADNLSNVTPCVQATTEGYREPNRRQMVIDMLSQTEVKVIDPGAWICGPETCPVIVGNLMVFKDKHHLSTPYVRMLTPLLADALGFGGSGD
ncbi:acyltransferase family protein [Stackebrandtia albiflava]|uniref:acyltransferase family protein n=1 Tax=Stackebrandtia albiflava TaxID=406432 RepID=UPI0013158D0E|nr:acyltransferase family protein [Stackebrandtia albiflava]